MDTKALRQKVLDLAIRGKLVPQDPNDEPASVLLERIRQQKQQMVKEDKLKAKDIKNDTIIFVGEDNLHYEKFTDGTVKCIEDEILFDIPTGWAWERLSNLATFSGGKTPSTSNREYWEGNILWVTSKDMKSKYIDSSLLMISKKGLEQMQLYPENTLLLVTRSGILRHTIPVAILKKPATINQDLKAIMPYIPNLEEYILTCIKGMESRLILEYTKAGTTVENINFDAFQKILLPIPPESQIQRIISAANDASDVIDNLKTDQEDLIDIISKTKSKLLDLAIRGKLVPQDPADEPASVLLERIRAEKEELIKQGKIKRDKKESIIFRGEDNSYYEKLGEKVSEYAVDELPGGWIVGSFSQVNMFASETIDPSNFPDEMFELYSVPNFEAGTPEIICGKEIGSSKQSICKNDVLVCKINPRINRAWITGHITPYRLLGSSEWIVFRNHLLFAPYLRYYFSSPYFRKLMLSNVSGVGGSLMRAQPESVKKYPILIPPYQEQLRIAERIDELFALLAAIEKSLT